MKASYFKIGLLLSFLGTSSAFSVEPSCDDLMMGLSPEVQSAIHDLAKLRYDLDQQLVQGEENAVTRTLQSQYDQKESEVLAAAKFERDVLIQRLRAEIESIQKEETAETGRKSTAKEVERQEADSAEVGVDQIGELKIHRTKHTASLVSNDQILILGGLSPGNSNAIELVDLKTGESTQVGTFSELHMRKDHQQITLPNGKVLLTGGRDVSNDLDWIDEIDPHSWEVKTIGHMTTVRQGHAQTLLPDGKILISGGWAKLDLLKSIEIFDPKTKESKYFGDLLYARDGHVQGLLPDGRVVVVGGNDKGMIEAINLKTGQSEVLGEMSPRVLKAGYSILPDGRIVRVGGYDRDTRQYLESIEVFDPKTKKSEVIGKLNQPRHTQKQVVLNDGRILVVGGFSDPQGDSIEIIDPDKGRSEVIGSLIKHHTNPTLTVLPDQSIVVIGGETDSALRDISGIYRIRAGRR